MDFGHRRPGKSRRTVMTVSDVPWWGMISSAAAPVLLVGGWTVAAERQPPSFDPMSDTVSELMAVNATDRWVMTTAFLAVGICYVITGTALRPARLAAADPDHRCRRWHAGGGEPPARRRRRVSAARDLGGTGIRGTGGLAGRGLAAGFIGALGSAAGVLLQRRRYPAHPADMVRRGDRHRGRAGRPGGTGRGRGPGALPAYGGAVLPPISHERQPHAEATQIPRISAILRPVEPAAAKPGQRLSGYIITFLTASILYIAGGEPLLPLQTLWVSFTTLSIQAVGLGYCRPAAGLMDRPPLPQAGRSWPAG